MKLQCQPNPWTCYATAFAIAMNIDVKDLFNLIGHDGSKIIWPEIIDDRFNRSGHHIQELVDAAYILGYLPIAIDACPCHGHFIHKEDSEPLSSQLWLEDKCVKRMDLYLKNNYGVLVGRVGFNFVHAVAWDGNNVYDPRGKIENLQTFEFNLMTFYLMKRMY